MLQALLLRLLTPPVIREKAINISTKIIVYALLVAGIIWLSVANYNFFTNNFNGSLGAAISGALFFVSAILVKLRGNSIEEKIEHQSYLTGVAKEALPLINEVTAAAKYFLSNQNFRQVLPLIGAVWVVYKFVRR